MRQRLFAYFMAREQDDPLTVAHKRRLFKDLSGTVLEIGPGAGPNLDYFPAGIRWMGIEPNPYMHAYLHQRAERLGFPIELRGLEGERLAVEDESVDYVVSTLVLCSVPNQADTLAEIRRVLKPGGRFVFFEHVAAPDGSGLRRVQRMLRPAWKWFGDGCHPDRETWATIEAAGFSEVQIEHFRLPEGPVAPHIAGFAIK
ncbi:MAG: class I SAM-dependent methyltransferase [Chloroflexi bacterium]|nr:class I SAM-dependent methyltransferase [Chloroflexota bacterium]